MTPTISTARLSLRPLLKGTPRQVRWLRDPEVVRFSEQRHGEHSLSSQLRYVSTFAGRSHLWGIYLAENGDHIGNLSAVHDEANNVCEVGILIGEIGCWHRGIGGEAWRATCTWLLDKDCGGVRKLEAGCMRSNVAMLKMLRSSKFVEEGERLNHFLENGSNPVGMVLFGRMR